MKKNASDLRSELSKMDLDPGYFCKFVKDQFVRKFIKTRELVDIIDIGCDTGYMAGLLNYDKYKFKYYGIDIRDSFNNDYIKNKNQKFKKVKNTKDHISKLKDEGVSFDCILLLDVLEHFKDKQEAKEVFKNCVDICKTNGYILVSTPNSVDGEIQWPKYHKWEFSAEEVIDIGYELKLFPLGLFGWSMSDEVFHETNKPSMNDILPSSISRVLCAMENPAASRDVMHIFQKLEKNSIGAIYKR
jgi:SAM-dependent methyltransferase